MGPSRFRRVLCWAGGLAALLGGLAWMLGDRAVPGACQSDAGGDPRSEIGVHAAPVGHGALLDLAAHIGTQVANDVLREMVAIGL